ncbi:MAG: hypothetical protein OCD03_14970 [Hyphomicrobiales bacterium]
MPDDLEIVKYLLTCMNSNEMRKLSHVISPDIEIIDPIFTKTTFEEYAKHLGGMVQHVESQLVNIEKAGDVYLVNMIFTLIDNSDGYHSKFDATFHFTFAKHMVVRSELVRTATEEDYKYLYKYANFYSKIKT